MQPVSGDRLSEERHASSSRASQPDGLNVAGVELATDPIIVRVIPRLAPMRCPACGPPGGRKHGHYEQTLADLPWRDRPVCLRLRLRRFRCPNKACPLRTFSESFGGAVVSHARRSERLRHLSARNKWIDAVTICSNGLTNR